MEKYFIESLSVAFIFIVFKVFEKKFIIKEEIVLKDLVKDSIIIYFCGIAGLFVFSQIQEEPGVLRENIGAFVDNPKF